VPVYFHIVTDGAIGALTDTQVAAQMGVLNTTFAGGEGGDYARALRELVRHRRIDELKDLLGRVELDVDVARSRRRPRGTRS